MVPIIIPVQSYPQYVKKEHLEEYLKKLERQSRRGIVAGIVFIMVCEILLLLLFVNPWLPLITTFPINSLLIISASLIISLGSVIYISQIEPLDEKLLASIKEDKSDMVTIPKSLIRKNLVNPFWILLLVNLIAIVASAILLPVKY